MAALSAASTHYRRHTPEDTVLYRVVQEHLDTFLAQAEYAEGAGRLPAFVKHEFEDYLKCGILAHGFARLRCSGCADESLVPFS
jgi:hypothetical protein